MSPVIASIFRNGRNQAVRIPVELSLDAETVTIERQGDALSGSRDVQIDGDAIEDGETVHRNGRPVGGGLKALSQTQIERQQGSVTQA